MGQSGPDCQHQSPVRPIIPQCPRLCTRARARASPVAKLRTFRSTISSERVVLLPDADAVSHTFVEAPWAQYELDSTVSHRLSHFVSDAGKSEADPPALQIL